MENIRTKYYYEDADAYENRGEQGIYIAQNLRTIRNGELIRKSSQDVIQSLANDIVKNRLLSAKKQVLYGEKVIQYTFTTKLNDEKASIIEINIPSSLKESIYSDLVRNDIESFDKLTQLGKKEQTSNRTNRVIAALIGLGIAVSTCVAVKKAVDYENQQTTETISQIDKDVLENVYGEDVVEEYIKSITNTEETKTYIKK